MAYDFSKIGIEGQEAYDQHILTQAQAKLQAAAAQAKEEELAAQQKQDQLDQTAAQAFSDIAKGNNLPPGDLTQDQPESRSDTMRRMGDLMMKGGAFDRAEKLYTLADNMDKTQSGLDNDQLTRGKTKLESTMMTADLVYQHIGTAKSQSEYEAGLRYLKDSPALSDEEKAHLDTLPDEWDPRISSFLADQAISAKDAANNQIQEQQNALRQQEQVNTEKYRANQLAIDRMKLRQQQEEIRIKQREGQSASAPNDNELKAARAAVANQIFSGTAPTEDSPNYASFEAGASSIAARAKDMIRTNRNLDWNTAVNRAIIESQSNGEWNTSHQGGMFGYGGEDVTSFTQQTGKSPDNAAVLPPAKDGKPDASKLEAGKYYITSRGVAKWNGKAFEAASQ